MNVEITSDHPHDLLIPLADIAAGVAKTYVIAGDHTHAATLSTAQFESLRAGQIVGLISSEDDDHMHLVQIQCA